jgi:hypothetical protein
MDITAPFTHIFPPTHFMHPTRSHSTELFQTDLLGTPLLLQLKCLWQISV